MLLRNQKPNYIYNVEVEKWQIDLAYFGYNLKVDGLFGDITERETRKFQRDMHIVSDGIVGDQTRAAMETLRRTKVQIYRRGSRGSMVTWIQQQYLDRGYKLAVDGIFGPETERITRLFQQDMRIGVDGIVGPITLEKLKQPFSSLPDDNPIETPAVPPANPPTSKIKVYIDNGHEPGNVNGGSQGYKEWEGNLKSARYLKEILDSTNKFDTMLTYDWNKTASVRQRGNQAASWGAQLLFSIHSNAGGGSGTECYYSIRIPNDRQYAAILTEKVSKEFGIPNRGAKTRESQTTKGADYMGIINSAQSGGVKHILLVESMFHDNANEEKLLLQDSTHQKLAQIYAEVISNMF
ncbi:N-acetylmuramoyl-L-alanine amidase [Alkalibaculum sporogenes]|nr:peptidoglycan-binding protein [Alkalibaculum sporogenes]